MSKEAYRRGVTVTGTLAEIGPGLSTGHIRTEENGKKYVLLKAAGTIADGVGCKKDTTTGTELTVIASANVDEFIVGVNNTGASISSGTYFWALKEGIGYGAPDAGGWNDGDTIFTSATAATFDGAANAAAGNNAHTPVGTAVSDDDQGTTANNLIYFRL